MSAGIIIFGILVLVYALLVIGGFGNYKPKNDFKMICKKVVKELNRKEE